MTSVRTRLRSLASAAAIVAAASVAVVAAARAADSPELGGERAASVGVMVRGDELVRIRAPLGTQTVEQRAAAIERRISGALGGAPETVHVIASGDRIDLFAGDQFIMSVTDADALPAGRTRAQFAADAEASLREALRREQSSRGLIGFLRNLALSLLEIVIAAALFVAGTRLFRRVASRLETATPPAIRLQKLELVRSSDVRTALTALFAVARLVAMLTLVTVSVDVVLANFPWTRELSVGMFTRGGAFLMGILRAIVAYLPNLGVIAVVVIGTVYAIRVLRVVAGGVSEGRIVSASFPAEWANPTFKIARFILIALAIVVVFPYLPASGSPAFQGMSIFLGFLVSFAGGSSISNIVAGLVMTYMRPFVVGDRVQIADSVGDVIEANLLVVRIRTIKNVDVSIPNSLVLGAHIVNYSAVAAKHGLILHTTVTIGYDAPWRKVHELLLAAAKATEGIVEDPAPFVLQTALDDFYVHYQINAYTRDANAMARTESLLRQNIQDRFNEAGMEIMSPHYNAFRDGTGPEIPAEYRDRVSAARRGTPAR